MKVSIQAIRLRFVEITFLTFLLVLASRASLANDQALPLHLSVNASEATTSLYPINPLDPR
jgi:hypothetical protein